MPPIRRTISWIPAAAAVITAAVLTFSFVSYQRVAPLADELLRGNALMLGSLVEQVSSRTLSPQELNLLKTPDVAYFSLIDHTGRLVFHSNHSLIGEQVDDRRYQAVFDNNHMTEQQVRLGTGERVYELQQVIHPLGKQLVIRIALHTWQADQMQARAQGELLTVWGLIIAVWGLGIVSWRFYHRELARRVDEARTERLAALGTLAATLAHEVRTPLAGIKGFAQLLEEQLEQDRHLRYLERIVGESQRLERLVSDLLDFVRQEEQPQGNAELRHELETVWEGLLSGKLTGVARIDLSGVPQQVWLQCHPERLNQILLNLLTNALGASDRQGVIRVEAKFDDGFWEIAIADSGTGFAADTLKRAFDPFYTTSATGTGLGLPLCRTIVEGYGGSIALGNRQPTGAVVTLRVPAHKE